MGRNNPNHKTKNIKSSILGLFLLISVTATVWFYSDRLKQTVFDLFDHDSLTSVAINESSKIVPQEDLASEEPLSDAQAKTNLEWQVLNQPDEEPQINLPQLLDSDRPFQQTLLSISPGLAPWVQTDQLIRKYILIANDFSQGLTLANHMRFLKPLEPFSVDLNQSHMFISSKTYQRFDFLAYAIDAIDVKALVAAYKKFRPLFVQVFAEFSYPEEFQLEDSLEKAAEQILAAPVIEGQIALVRPSVHYKYEDKNLEALTPVSKQMIRIGPYNTRIIQYKVQQLVEELANLQQ